MATNIQPVIIDHRGRLDQCLGRKLPPDGAVNDIDRINTIIVTTDVNNLLVGIRRRNDPVIGFHLPGLYPKAVNAVQGTIITTEYCESPITDGRTLYDSLCRVRP